MGVLLIINLVPSQYTPGGCDLRGGTVQARGEGPANAPHLLLAVIFEDEEHSLDEVREIVIGRSVLQRLLLVSFTERGEDLVRIISARKGTRRERSDYEEGTRP